MQASSTRKQPVAQASGRAVIACRCAKLAMQKILERKCVLALSDINSGARAQTAPRQDRSSQRPASPAQLLRRSWLVPVHRGRERTVRFAIVMSVAERDACTIEDTDANRACGDI